MANEKLIRASEARKAILNADPKLAYCIDNIKAVDAVEVVRCRDCKHLQYGYQCYNPLGMSLNNDVDAYVLVNEDDFCNYGERSSAE